MEKIIEQPLNYYCSDDRERSVPSWHLTNRCRGTPNQKSNLKSLFSTENKEWTRFTSRERQFLMIIGQEIAKVEE